MDVTAINPYLARLQCQQPALYAELLAAVAEQKAPNPKDIRHRIAQCGNELELDRELRQMRQRHFGYCTLLDWQQRQSIEDSMALMSAVADELVMATYHWWYQQLAQRQGYPQQQQQMLILAMGKLGAGELNFSSDIDLIYLYPQKGVTDKKGMEHQQFFTRVAQKMTNSLSQITADGFVFRVDLRLRPMGDSGPLVMHLDAFQSYCYELARDWERFAMQKARVLNAADTPYVDELNAIIQPFVYRKYLDFSLIESLRDMKRRIQAESQRRNLANNIKLGIGGIREVEFFIQTLQLIHGGKNPNVRSRSVFTALNQLVNEALLPADDAALLAEEYRLLRLVEHRLQQYNDEQTQTLPTDEQVLTAVACGCGMQDAIALKTRITQARERISNVFGQLLQDPAADELTEGSASDHHVDHQSQQQTASRLLDALADRDEFTCLVQALDDDAAQQVAELSNSLHAFWDWVNNTAMSDKAEQKLRQLLQRLLCQALSECPLPWSATGLNRAFAVFKKITSRLAYLDLLRENHQALQQLLRVCERSDWIAEQIALYPILLDELLSPHFLADQRIALPEWIQTVRSELRQYMMRIEMDDEEGQIDGLRQFKAMQQLRIAAADVCDALATAKVSDRLTYLAELLIDYARQLTRHQLINKYALEQEALEAIEFAVIGFGKFGGIELGYGSDLDLVFLYDTPLSTINTRKGAMTVREFLVKYVQRLVHICQVKTRFGTLYEIDLRLRPSGASGLLVSHIDAFASYQLDEAWTWEHQALVRARFISGEPRLKTEFERIRLHSLQARNRRMSIEKLRHDVATMRQKMRDHLDTSSDDSVDLKQAAGGIADIEFITQFWVLSRVAEHPDVAHYSDNLRQLEALGQANCVAQEQVSALIDAYLLIRNHQHRFTLNTKMSTLSPNALPQLEAARSAVRAIYHDVFEQP